MTDIKPRCWRCDRQLGEELTRPWDITCPRCHAKNKPEEVMPSATGHNPLI